MGGGGRGDRWSFTGIKVQIVDRNNNNRNKITRRRRRSEEEETNVRKLNLVVRHFT